MRKKVKRIKEIVSVFLKYGTKDGIKNSIKSINDPIQVRMILEELGPTFVKIGQILSTRPDILPEPFIEEFKRLQDKVKPESFEVIKKELEKALGKPIREVFDYFEETPIASASMAQVHAGVLKDGSKVVVKIQRPKVKEMFMNDLGILKRVAGITSIATKNSVINPNEIVKELYETAKKEVDFLNEAMNMKRFYENNKEDRYIVVPKLHEEYTTSNLIIMEYVEGIKIDNIIELENAGCNLKDIGFKLTNNFLKQIIEDGFFHGDPHPGNLLVKDKNIIYLDFGAMGELNKQTRNTFNQLLYAIVTKNIELITKCILKIGIKRDKIDNKKIYSDVEEMYNEYIEMSVEDIDFVNMLSEIFKICKSNSIGIPRDIVILMKSVVTIQGLVEKLIPEESMMNIAAPYIKKQVIKKINFKKDILEQVDNAYMLYKYGFKIPIKFLELMNSALAGKMKVQLEHINIDKGIVETSKMINRLVFAVIASSIVISSSVLISMRVGPKIYDISILGFIGYASAGIMGFWLLISILKSGRL